MVFTHVAYITGLIFSLESYFRDPFSWGWIWAPSLPSFPCLKHCCSLTCALSQNTFDNEWVKAMGSLQQWRIIKRSGKKFCPLRQHGWSWRPCAEWNKPDRRTNSAWFHLAAEPESQTHGKRVGLWLPRARGGIMGIAVQKVQSSRYTRRKLLETAAEVYPRCTLG